MSNRAQAGAIAAQVFPRLAGIGPDFSCERLALAGCQFLSELFGVSHVFVVPSRSALAVWTSWEIASPVSSFFIRKKEDNP